MSTKRPMMMADDDPEPCTQEAYHQGCTCRMQSVHSAMIDPPEPILDRNCPLHGWAPDPDDERDRRIEDEADRRSGLIPSYWDED